MRDGRSSSVLFRVSAGGASSGDLLERAELWDMDTGRRFGTPGPLSPSAAARAAGWRHEAALPPGRYFLRLLTPDRRDAAPADMTFIVPEPPPPVLYIGSFRVQCSAASPCRVAPVPEDESEAARTLVAAQAPAPPAPVTRLAQPYPAAFARTGLPRPMAPEISVDARLWVAAIDWNAFLNTETVPQVPAEMPAQSPEGPQLPRSEAPDWSGARMVSSYYQDPFTTLAAVAVTGAILIVAVPIYLIARAIAEDQRNRRTRAEAQVQAEALRAAALAQDQWSPCAAGIAATLAPDRVERDLRANLSPRREEGRRAALPDPWNVTVARVIFRHCGTQPDHHGVEVATRWTARRPGEADPAFDIAYTRSVAGATRDTRLVHSERPPWELPVATEAACRPLADYCGATGTALLRDEVLRGVTEARDAIAAAR
ncbi:hypothetical protein [Neoroseomonas rubea]|uniref:hypothetical protein n=1 Tax=Neoroseomonas rubea TaxID=2748666 RepID=UPI0018DF160A|nr:hypothetical protein [Roseomonas rubea]